MPGMIDAHCHIGIFGEGTGFYLLDGNENTNPATPQIRGLDAVNPQDMALSGGAGGRRDHRVHRPGAAPMSSVAPSAF